MIDRELMNHIVAGRDLSPERMHAAMRAIMTGQATEAPARARVENGAMAVAPRPLRRQSMKMRPRRRFRDISAMERSRLGPGVDRTALMATICFLYLVSTALKTEPKPP